MNRLLSAFSIPRNFKALIFRPNENYAVVDGFRALSTTNTAAHLVLDDISTEPRYNWTREEIQKVFDTPLLELVFKAAAVHRAYFNGPNYA